MNQVNIFMAITRHFRQQWWGHWARSRCYNRCFRITEETRTFSCCRLRTSQLIRAFSSVVHCASWICEMNRQGNPNRNTGSCSRTPQSCPGRPIYFPVSATWSGRQREMRKWRRTTQTRTTNFKFHMLSRNLRLNPKGLRTESIGCSASRVALQACNLWFQPVKLEIDKRICLPRRWWCDGLSSREKLGPAQ